MLIDLLSIYLVKILYPYFGKRINIMCVWQTIKKWRNSWVDMVTAAIPNNSKYDFSLSLYIMIEIYKILNYQINNRYNTCWRRGRWKYYCLIVLLFLLNRIKNECIYHEGKMVFQASRNSQARVHLACPYFFQPQKHLLSLLSMQYV